jgi:hypothetical protein
MKILHIIPSAFNYFDEIRSEAFAILEAENNLGIDANAITLEYGATSREEKAQVKEAAPSRRYLGQESILINAQSWDKFDIINLHCPFFGAAGEILKWARNYPGKALVITYHFDFGISDFFSYIIKIYNYFYLPKLFKLSANVCFFASRREESASGIKILKNEQKAVILGMQSTSEDIHTGGVVEDLIMVYNNIMLNNTK